MWNEARRLEDLFVLRIAPKFGKRWSRVGSRMYGSMSPVYCLARFEPDLAAVVNAVLSTQ